MVTVGQTLYNSLFLYLYNYLSSSLPEPQLQLLNDFKEVGIEEFVTSHGYQLHEYELTTPDGYLLSLFRLTPGNGTNGTDAFSGRPPVLLMHGFVSSAYDWVVIGPGRSVAYSLVDEGYDVWLGNARGNRYSRKHVQLDPEEHAFWQYSFHEIGYYDVPTMIDFIINETEHESIYYVGHSQGSTVMFVMASERPEYISKIRLFVAVSPVVHANGMPAFLAELGAQFYDQLEWFVSTLQYNEFFGRTETFIKFTVVSCAPQMPFSRMCSMFVRSNMGYSQDFETVPLPAIIQSGPAGSSIYQMLHFLQGKLSDTFRQYDHGWALNNIKYGKGTPPKYNLRTTIPTALIYGDNDWLSTEEDNERISRKLKNIKLKQKLSSNHVDFIMGPIIVKTMTKIILKLFAEN